MIERHRVRAVLAAAALACALPARAATLLPLDYPPEPEHPYFDLHPHLGLHESYDTNIFLLPNPVSSWITTAETGLRVPIRIRDRQRLELNYDGAYRDYSYAHTGSLKNAFIHDAYAHYWYRTGEGLVVRAKDDYINTIDPATSELTQLVRRWANTAVGQVAYEPPEGRLWAAADVSDLRNKYVTLGSLAQALDRYDLQVGGRVGVQVQPKTVAYAAYHRQIIHFTDNPVPSKDSKGDLIGFGMEGQFAPKLTGRAEVGMVNRLYDAPPTAGAEQHTQNFTAMALLRYDPDDRTRAEVGLDRSLQESAFDVNQYYIANAFTLNTSHRFLWGLTLHLNGAYEIDKYPTTTRIGPLSVNRLDTAYQGSTAAEYAVTSWLNAGVSYLYQARFSRDLSQQFNYRDQITAAFLTAYY